MKRKGKKRIFLLISFPFVLVQAITTTIFILFSSCHCTLSQLYPLQCTKIVMCTKYKVRREKKNCAWELKSVIEPCPWILMTQSSPLHFHLPTFYMTFMTAFHLLLGFFLVLARTSSSHSIHILTYTHDYLKITRFLVRSSVSGDYYVLLQPSLFPFEEEKSVFGTEIIKVGSVLFKERKNFFILQCTLFSDFNTDVVSLTLMNVLMRTLFSAVKCSATITTSMKPIINVLSHVFFCRNNQEREETTCRP